MSFDTTQKRSPITITGGRDFGGFCITVISKCKKFTIFIFSLISFSFCVSAVYSLIIDAEIRRLKSLGICSYTAMKGKFEP